MMTKRKKFLGKLVAGCLFFMLSFVVSFHAEGASEHPNSIEASRSLSPTQKSESLLPSQKLSSEQLMEAGSGYCSSVGGSTSYESISEVKVNRVGANVVQIVVDVYIANPTGCTSGNPCPEYDQSPEYVNVWIDWDGDKVFESNEKVLDEAMSGYLNINYNGTMTATSQVTIPDGAKSSTYLRANLGWGYDPNDPCEYSWTWGNVIDQPLEIITAKVLQLDVLNDVPIRDITDPIWQKTFDLNGNLIDVSPVQNDPIADDMTSGSFSIKATLGAHPSQPSWTPKVSYQWFIQGCPGYNGTGQFIGWDGTFNVSTPQLVDQYTLNLIFTVYDDQGNVITQNQSINSKLYVVYGSPDASVSPPKVKWLDKATTWGKYAVGPWSASIFLNSDIYSNTGWSYRDTGGGGGTSNWYELVEDTHNASNCYTFSQVWYNISKVLGVSGTSAGIECRSYGQHDKGFVTKLAVSLDGDTGNAHPQGGATDRWRFSMHQIGKYSTTYFDPTFGNTYYDKEGYIEWHQIDNFHSVVESGVTKIMANLTDGHKVYAINNSAPWGDYEYHSPSYTDSLSGSGNVSFTDNYTINPIDTDGSGKYNKLYFSIDLNVITPDDYSVFGMLKYSGGLVSSRKSKDSSMPTGYSISGASGTVTAELAFSGEDIYQKGYDGIYTIEVFLMNSEGILLDQKVIATENYYYVDFGETLANIESISDFGEDTDGDNLFDFLVANVNVNVIKDAEYSISGILYEGTTQIGSASVKQALISGSNHVELKFDGKMIYKLKVDGPYKMEVVLSDDTGSQIGYKEAMTSAYTWSQFKPSSANITDSFLDYGTDSNGDNYYDFLTIETDLDIIQAGNYKVSGWLNDSAGKFIAFACSEGYLGTGNQTVIINFDGENIYDHEVNGPYVLNYLVIYEENNNPADNTTRDVYMTSAYNYTDFQSPPSPLVSLTDNYDDTGVDTDGDGDGDFDLLRIQIGVISSADGNIYANGRLVDSFGNEIQWASGYANVVANTPQMISIDFDGRLVYANMKNGPYFLKNLNVYHTGDPSQNVYEDDAYTTGTYAYTDFDPTEIIHGVVTDNGKPVLGALVSISDVGFDYTDSEGKYHIAVISAGTYTVIIEASGYTSWQIYVNEARVGEGTSIEVSVSEEEAIQVDFKQQVQGDLDGDGDVDYDDYLIFRTAYGSCSGDDNFMAAADLDGDGCVTINDYRIFRTIISS